MPWINSIIYISIYIGLISTSFFILSYLDYLKREKKYFSEEELPFVSAIVPAYNESKSIARTISSLLKIDYPSEKFEIIIVDDGSKDDTYKIAKSFESDRIKVFTKKNGGKASALNLGIKHVRGEIVYSVDADTYPHPMSVRKMVQSFTNPRVMAVTPAMLVHNPKNVWERLQQMEYALGVFLRKSFASLNAVYITPGAFSCYRKSFFDKYGGYSEGNVTEDIELSLRIQHHGFFIDNCPEAMAWTSVPSSLKSLTIQRRRWYFGYIKNLFNYRTIIGKDYGDLGIFIIPVGILSIIFSIVIMSYMFSKAISDSIEQISFWINNGISYNFLEFNLLFFERLGYSLFNNPIFLSIFIFVFFMLAYLIWAGKRVGNQEVSILNLGIFFMIFAPLFGFWWVISGIYSLTNKTVKWR